MDGRRRRCAALIPIRKSSAWWELTQEERRRIFEDKSHHIAASLKYLPRHRAGSFITAAISASRSISWPGSSSRRSTLAVFEDWSACSRGTEEWSYVEREVDVRVVREVLAA